VVSEVSGVKFGASAYAGAGAGVSVDFKPNKLIEVNEKDPESTAPLPHAGAGAMDTGGTDAPSSNAVSDVLAGKPVSSRDRMRPARASPVHPVGDALEEAVVPAGREVQHVWEIRTGETRRRVAEVADVQALRPCELR